MLDIKFIFSKILEYSIWIFSKILGFSILGFSFIFKIPQILIMYFTKSADGLSEMSCMTEILFYLNTALFSYHSNLSISTYGENVIILSQSITILVLLYQYSSGNNLLVKIQRLLFFPLISAYAFVCLQDKLLTEQQWEIIAASSLFLISVSSLTQIFKSFREKSTGPLSSITFILAIAGNASRLFTLIVESGDWLIIAPTLYSLVLNVVLLVQIFIFAPKQEEKDGDEPKQEEKDGDEPKQEEDGKKKNKVS